MFAEIVAFVVLLAVIAIFGALAWRLTLHLIGFEQTELAAWANRFREARRPSVRPDMTSVPAPVPAALSGGVAERVDRVLARLDDKP